jgi:SAM-dependent methyltransferase
MSGKTTVTHASSLDSLSHGFASSTNPFHLEDLTWEHFWVDEFNGELQTNREDASHIRAASRHFGSLEGKSVLELGAYEGYQSRDLERYGAAEVTAVEGNPRNFLKCCAVKNHYQLNRTQYLLGDCSVYLDECDRRFDLVIAAGILYHLFDPIAALENICRLTNVVSICTTYYHPELQGFNFTGQTKPIELAGLEDRVLYERLNTQIVKGKKHGMNTTAWMFDYDTLLAYLHLKGFTCDILVRNESPEPFRLRTRILAYR